MAFRQTWRLLAKKFVPAMSAGILLARCDDKKKFENESIVKVKVPNLDKLSYDYMIKQSAVDAVNSASQSLTIAYTAIESTSREYRLLLSQLMSLMEDTLIYQVTDEHEDLIIAARSEVETKKKILTDLIIYMEYVQRMVEAVSVVSNSAGMDNLAMTLCQRMDDALKNKDRELGDNQLLEKAYYRLQEKCIKES
ncbi:uncharacterized protein LOC103568210 [Microplitis demolitor]|uniref:uncharacterized protein LOC103568210 n=1 Tax=Microplitis demolitor TaxID=69319 RepID=UPI0004CD9EB4|nr:uncharacterized protein LOC103568210 [Microplitis demolitor]